MSSGTNKQRLDQNNAKIQQIQQTLNRKIIGEGNIAAVKGIADGTLTEFKASDFGVTSLGYQRFRAMTSLTKLNLEGVTDIPEYTAYGCTGITELVLDKNTTNIGQYAFAYCNNATSTIDLEFLSSPTINAYAFYFSSIRSLKGNIGSIGGYAFNEANRSQLKTIDVKITGSIGQFAFEGQGGVNSINLKQSNVTSLGQSAFKGVGRNRTSPQSNVLVFDFRNSTFTTVQQQTFRGFSTSSKNTYFDIYFPSTVTTISGSFAFGSSNYFNIYYKSVPNLTSTLHFDYATNYKNFFYYTLLYTARNSTNWSTNTTSYPIQASIFGYADENTFNLGDTLPSDDGNGHSLVWYSDRAMTNQVTTVSDPTQIYYCDLA